MVAHAAGQTAPNRVLGNFRYAVVDWKAELVTTGPVGKLGAVQSRKRWFGSKPRRLEYRPAELQRSPKGSPMAPTWLTSSDGRLCCPLLARAHRSEERQPAA